MYWQDLISCKKFFLHSTNAGKYLLITGYMILLTGWVYGLFYAPTDSQQGDAYRIIFIHVPCASGGMCIYAGISFCAIASWIWRIKLADVMLAAFAQIGAVLTLIALITGSIWGQPMWGDWWVWDARLTSCLILLLFYLAIIILRQVMADSEAANRACAFITILGAIDLPIIHYSVNWWHTLHQPATLLSLQKPTIAISMLVPLLISMLGLAILTCGLSVIKMRTIIIKRYIHQQYIQQWLKQYYADR